MVSYHLTRSRFEKMGLLVRVSFCILNNNLDPVGIL